MSLIHGRRITPEQVESIVSREFTPQDFASLCNAITWASAGRRCSSLPSFTGRVNVKDGGINAEWQTELPDDHNYSSPLLGSGWNVFQYKQRDIFAQGRDKTFSSLKAGLKGAVKELYERTGRRPDRYVLFTNLDLTHDTEVKNAANPQKRELKESILKGYDEPDNVHIEIVGAGELSAFLNDLPHLRSAFFTTERFLTRQKYWDAHTKQKIFGAKVKLVGRDAELADLRSMIDEPEIRAVVLSGPHNIGKTRLALEATAHRPIETVVALDVLSMSVSDLLELETPGMEIIVIIKDPEPKMAKKFVEQALVSTSLKVLITLPTAEEAPKPNFGQDHRVRVIQLNPLSYSQAQELLKAAEAKLDYSLESWVIAQAGGNPGILLFAANRGTELRKTTATFVDEVAGAFEKEIHCELGDAAIEILRLLSLLTHVGIKREPSQEIEVICSLFGGNLQLNTVLNYLPRLAKAGIVQMRDRYVEVLPPLFANWLADSALRGRFTELLLLFVALNQSGRLRLIHRLRALKGEEVNRFWDELFGPNGLFKDLPSALAGGYMLPLVAEAVPERTSRLIEEGLKRIGFEERSSITKRGELVRTLEQLLFRQKTSATALRCLVMLAETNNVTSILCECFRPLHPQFPLPLQDRLDVLKEILSPRNSVELRLIGVEAIKSGLKRMEGISLRPSMGREPLDSQPRMTDGDIWDYIESMVNLLMTLSQSEEPKLAESARDALPRVLTEGAIRARPEVAVAQFQTVVDWVLTDKVTISVSDLTGALIRVRNVFNEHIGKTDGETAAKLKKYSEEIEALINRIDKGDFPTRLKRWAGKYTPDDHERELDDAGEQVYRCENELRALAQEAVDNPEVLTDELLTWLCSDDAQRAHAFFLQLGKVDSERKWLSKIEQISANKNGATVFPAYFAGLRQHDRAFVSKRLDELTEARQVTPEAIVRATLYLDGDLAGVKRMETLIQEKLVDPVFVVETLKFGGWLDSLSSDEYLRLLKAIAGPDMENAAAVIDFFGMWLHLKRPVEGQLAEFAWQCLEAAPTVTLNDANDCDQLASKLAQSDTERGFRLLEKLLMQPYRSECWNPIDHHGYEQRSFWNFLREVDRGRTLRVVLSVVALDNPSRRHDITWYLREVVNQESDADFLIEFAFSNEQQAELVCESISAERPGFWPISLKIIERYPNSQNIQSALTDYYGQGGWGPLSVHMENRCEEVERVLNDPATPTVARPWLEQLESSLRNLTEVVLASEIDREVNDWRRVEDDAASPERIWAINTLLRLGKADEIRKLRSKDEFLSGDESDNGIK